MWREKNIYFTEHDIYFTELMFILKNINFTSNSKKMCQTLLWGQNLPGLSEYAI